MISKHKSTIDKEENKIASTGKDIAIAKGNEEIAQLLLEKQDIDVSIKSI